MKVLVLKNGGVVLSFAQCPHTPPPDPRYWDTPLFWDYKCPEPVGWVPGYKVQFELGDPEEWV